MMAVSVTDVLSDPAKAMLTAREVIVLTSRIFGYFLPDSIIWVSMSDLIPSIWGRILGFVETFLDSFLCKYDGRESWDAGLRPLWEALDRVFVQKLIQDGHLSNLNHSQSARYTHGPLLSSQQRCS